MKPLCCLLIFSTIFFACNKDENRETIPTVKNIEVIGNTVKITWAHTTDFQYVQYAIKLNNELYGNPGKTFILNLDYDTDYSGEIIARYTNEKVTSVSFTFKTQKSKMLFFSTRFGTTYAFDLYTNRLVWQHDSTNSYQNHFSHDSLIITGTDKIRAFNIYNGKVVWRLKPYNNFYTDFTYVSDGSQLYFQEYYLDKTIAINLNTHEIKWQSIHQGSYLALGEHLYVANRFSESELIALDKSNGNILWGFNLDNNSTGAAEKISCKPVIFEKNIYFGDNIGRFYSVNESSGNKNWSKDFGLFKETSGSPAIYKNNILIPVEEQLYSLNQTTSYTNWRYSFSGYFYSSPFVYGNKVIVSSSGNGIGYVFAIDADTGRKLWELKIDGQVKSSPIVYEESIYIGSENKKFYKINLSDGQIKWEFTSNDLILTSAIIIIGAGEEVVYPNNSGIQKL